MREGVPALLLSAVVFLAFGFQTVGIFSDPISRSQLPLATQGDYNYGVLGWCPKDSSKSCSSYGMGYELQDGSTNSWSKSTQNTVSKIFIVHIIAAGLLLISLFLAVATLWPNPRFYIVVEIMLAASCLASALSFAVEIAMFRTSLKFAGWFTLPATILSIVANVALGLMQRSLHARLGRTSITGPNPLLENDTVPFHTSGGEFIVGRDEKQFKEPSVTASRRSVPSFQIPNPSSLLSHRGYEKVTDPKQGPQDSQSMNSSSQTQLNQSQRRVILPSSSSESVGAIARNQQQPQSQRQQQQQRQRQEKMLPHPPAKLGSVVSGSGSRSGSSENGNASMSGDNASTGAIIGATAGGAANYKYHPGYGARAQKNQAQREQTWSQQALNASSENINSTNPRQQYAPVHASNASVASTQIARIPAGSYMPEVGGSGHGQQETRQSPEVRAAGHQIPPAESATFDYHKDETQSKSPLAKSRVPNYSRMSAQESVAETSTTAFSKPATRQPMKPMLERFVESVNMDPDHKEDQEPYFDAPITRISTKSPESEASHYTSISERNNNPSAPEPNVHAQIAPNSRAPPQQSNQQMVSAATNQQLQQQQAYYQYQYQQQYMQQLAQAQQQGYQPGYQGYYDYNGQGAYAGYQGYSSPQQYQMYQSYDMNQPSYADFQSARPRQAHPAKGLSNEMRSPRPRQPPQTTQRSEMALQSNPDFSLGDLSKRKPRPGRR